MSDAMPSATLTLTSPDGVLRSHGVDLGMFDDVARQLADRARARGWRSPYIVAPAPGHPDGVAVSPFDAVSPTTWEHVGSEWVGRRVRVRWEDPSLSAPTTRPESLPGGRPRVIVGVITDAGPAPMRVVVAHGDPFSHDVVVPPAFAHVAEMPW